MLCYCEIDGNCLQEGRINEALSTPNKQKIEETERFKLGDETY